MKFKGFTLLESLFVLVIVSLFLLIPTMSVRSLQKHTEEALFFKRFERYISATQQSAIRRQLKTEITYSKSHFRFSYYSYKGGYADLAIPQSIQCTEVPDLIVFSPISGNYSDLKLIRFVIPEKQKEIRYQFQMGSGKYTKTIIE